MRSSERNGSPAMSRTSRHEVRGSEGGGTHGGHGVPHPEGLLLTRSGEPPVVTLTPVLWAARYSSTVWPPKSLSPTMFSTDSPSSESVAVDPPPVATSLPVTAAHTSVRTPVVKLN